MSSLPFSLNLTYCIKMTRISGPAGIGAIQASTAKITTRGRSQYRSLGRHPGSKVFRDHGISGKNGREKRPGFDKLLNAVARKDVDVVAAWSVDLLGRSLQHLIGFLEELRAKGVDLYLHQQGLDTSTPAGRALFQVMGVFAEFERSMIVARVNAGLKRARAEGKILGRPRVSQAIEQAIRRELAKGRGIHAVAKVVGVGAGTVQRVRSEVA